MKVCAFYKLQIKESHDGAMVTAENSAPYLLVYHLIDDTLRDENVVQPPTDVLGPRIRHIRPEGVRTLLGRIEVPERVDKLRFGQELGHPVPFLLREAGVLLVCLGIGQV